MTRAHRRPQAKECFWIGYCRKSTESEDKQIFTLRDQAAMIQDYYDRLPGEERESRPLRLLQEAQSAYRPGRLVFGKILQLASRGAVYGVIVVHPNRISRNHSDSGAFVQRLVDRQIVCLDTTGGKRYTGADSNDIFMLTLEGAMSWKDSRDKGDRILQAMRTRAAEGKKMGPVPIGYRSVYRPDGTRVLEVEADRAPLVRRLFELAATGSYSTQDLTAEAWRMGLRSRRRNRIQKPCLHKLLCNPFFKGCVEFDGVVAKGIHEPIIEEALWQRVQWALRDRRTDVGRPKDLTVRELFFFGNLLRCPKCGRSLCPYRAKGRYIYYECKNPETRCGMCVAQPALVEQLQSRLQAVLLDAEALDQLRARLLAMHRRQNTGEVRDRRLLNEEYERTQREIGEVFTRRKEAVALGVEDAVDLRLEELKRKRADLQDRLNALHDKGTTWIEKVIRAFELTKLLQEAILWGSRRQRELSLKALASNFTVEGKNLQLTLRTPIRQCAEAGGRREWWAEVYDVRTEVAETVRQMETAVSLLPEAVCP
jgi:site-specific DNA recombinase